MAHRRPPARETCGGPPKAPVAQPARAPHAGETAPGSRSGPRNPFRRPKTAQNHRNISQEVLDEPSLQGNN
eukprot:364568-Pyramimonas_sp.AAC.1